MHMNMMKKQFYIGRLLQASFDQLGFESLIGY